MPHPCRPREQEDLVAKGVARALPEGIDTTPTAFFADSPAFTKDAATDAYIKTCQASRLGEAVDQAYADGLQLSALVNDAIQAYNAKQYLDALDHYERALRTPGGEQLRVLNGLYLTNWKLDRREAAREAFERIVGYGVKADRLAVKFLFEPNAAQFTTDRETRVEYAMWVQEIAKGTVKTDKCLDVVGHTSATGSAEVNDRLSLQRADYVKGRLQGALVRVQANRRFAAKGVGSRELVVGTGKDDASDFLDRRVEFKTAACAACSPPRPPRSPRPLPPPKAALPRARAPSATPKAAATRPTSPAASARRSNATSAPTRSATCWTTSLTLPPPPASKAAPSMRTRGGEPAPDLIRGLERHGLSSPTPSVDCTPTGGLSPMAFLVGVRLASDTPTLTRQV